MHAMQTTDPSPIQTKQVPTQEQVNQWVDETLELFRNEHATGRRFTAWEVCLHIIAVHGSEYVIPHASRGAFIGVRELVRDKMTNDFMNNPIKPYASIEDVAPDGQIAIFWTPLKLHPVPQISTTPVVITIAADDGSGDSDADGNKALTISYSVGKFKFID